MEMSTATGDTVGAGPLPPVVRFPHPGCWVDGVVSSIDDSDPRFGKGVVRKVVLSDVDWVGVEFTTGGASLGPMASFGPCVVWVTGAARWEQYRTGENGFWRAHGRAPAPGDALLVEYVWDEEVRRVDSHQPPHRVKRFKFRFDVIDETMEVHDGE